MSRRRLALGALLCAAVLTLGAGTAAGGPATELFFSEYVEGSSNNKALEIYNGTDAPVTLDGVYDVQVSFNGGTFVATFPLSGTIAAGDVFVFAHASSGLAILGQADQTTASGLWNGDDAISLRKGGVAVDVIGEVGFDPGSQWGTGDASTADNTLRRKRSITAGDPDGSDDFDPAVEWNGFPQDTFDGLGWHAVGDEDAPPRVVDSSPGEGDTDVPVGASIAVTFSEPVTLDPGAFSIECTDSGSHTASVSGGPETYTVDPAADFAQAESCTVTVSANAVHDADPDDPPDTMAADASWTFATFAPPIPIGAVQGAVSDSDEGTAHVSPLLGDTVKVQGVITQRIVSRSSGGTVNYGFHLQNTAATADGDPSSSDGIFAFHSRFTTLRREGGGFYLPEVGDEVVLRGPVTEFFNLTQLSNPFLVSVVRDGVLLDVEVPALEVHPPADLAEASRWWERREGMRAQVPAGSVAIQKRDVFASTFDGEVWVVRGDSEVAQRLDAYARRAFRDPHPLDDVPDELFDNGNGYRIMMGSLGLKGATDDSTTLIAPARTFDTTTNAPVGGIYFSFGKYSVQVGDQLQLVRGVDPSLNAPPQSVVREKEWSAATLNVENLYDFRDDPHDGCDFAGNAGCPGVRPPFDYVPASEPAYQAHVAELAAQVAQDMKAPDLVLVQEAEDQDICAVAGGELACGAADDADGKPDTLQELALAIAAAGGPAYDAAYDRDGADDRGIVSGFLYRTDRVQLLAAGPGHPVLGSSPEVDYRGAPKAYNADVQNPKALNADLPADVDRSTGTDGSDVFTRAPQVGHFRVWRVARGVGSYFDVYAVSNHFSSGPDRRVGQRTEQAAYNAAIAEALPSDLAIVGGDLNVFPRPDDPFAPGHPLFPSDQLAPLYEAGLDNLYDTLVDRYPAAAYTYTFQGQAQTLDQLFVTDALLAELEDVRVAHVNADWPADHEGDGPRGASDHDPVVARFEHLPTKAGGTGR